MSSASSFGAVAEKDKFVEYITESNYSLLLFWDQVRGTFLCLDDEPGVESIHSTICTLRHDLLPQIAFAGKLEVSLDGTKAYQTVRLRDGRTYGWGGFPTPTSPSH